MNNFMKLKIVLFTFLVIMLTSCDTLFPAEEHELSASGVIEVVEVDISPEIGGRVLEVFSAQGDQVQN
jgi:multidrug efflux pump subunit AcrA (membrane-fusion protein)